MWGSLQCEELLPPDDTTASEADDYYEAMPHGSGVAFDAEIGAFAAGPLSLVGGPSPRVSANRLHELYGPTSLRYRPRIGATTTLPFHYDFQAHFIAAAITTRRTVGLALHILQIASPAV